MALRRYICWIWPSLLLLLLFGLVSPSLASPAVSDSITSSLSSPFVLRVSCGSTENVQTPPNNTIWSKDFGYSGGVAAKALHTSYISPILRTVRYFPESLGAENCYEFSGVPEGLYSVRVFFGLVSLNRVPLFDFSIEGTLTHSLKTGWINYDEQAFAEDTLFLDDGSLSLCFHRIGHEDPTILSTEIFQIDGNAYDWRYERDHGLILRTATRVNCGSKIAFFDGDRTGNRFWKPLSSFIVGFDGVIHTDKDIKKVLKSYDKRLYQSAIVGTKERPHLDYIVDVDPGRSYSVWLHFAEIDPLIKAVGDRVFDIFIDDVIFFKDVDIIKLSGDPFATVVLNSTILVNNLTLGIHLVPKKGYAIICAVEVMEIIIAESKTLSDEVEALQMLKTALELPSKLGWNGDPCVPQHHQWNGVDCRFNRTIGGWIIDALILSNQGLRGYVPKEISKLNHLKSIKLSGNSIQGSIPSSLGTLADLQILDLSYNLLNGSIPESLRQLTSLKRLNLNGNFLSGRVPVALMGRLLHNRASFNFTDNTGLCGISGLRSCRAHHSDARMVEISLGALLIILALLMCLFCYWKGHVILPVLPQIAGRVCQRARDIELSKVE